MYWYSRQTGYFIWSQIIHSKECNQCNGKDNIILLRYRIIVGLLGICCIAASQTLLICICLQSIMQRWKLQKSSSKMVQLWVKLFLLSNLYLYNKFSGLTHFCNTSWVFTNTVVFGCTPLLLDPPHLLGNAGVKLKVNIWLELDLTEPNSNMPHPLLNMQTTSTLV